MTTMQTDITKLPADVQEDVGEGDVLITPLIEALVPAARGLELNSARPTW